VTPLERLRARLEAHVPGQPDAVLALLVGLLAREHVLLEGPPGCGKSELARALGVLSGARLADPVLHRDLRAGDLLGDAVLEREIRPTGERLRQRRLPGALLDAELWLLDDLDRAPAEALAPLVRALARRRALGRSLPLECAIATRAARGPERDGAPAGPAWLECFALRVRLPGLIVAQRFDAARRVLERGEPAALGRVLDPRDRGDLQRAAAGLALPDEVARAWLELAGELGDSAALSDRLVLHAAPGLLRAHALLRGAAQVGREDLAVARLVLEPRLAAQDRARLAERIEAVRQPARVSALVAAGSSSEPGAQGGAARAGPPGSAAERRSAAIPAAGDPVRVASGVRPLLRALEGEWARGEAGGREDAAGAPRGTRRLRRLDELSDADPVEAWLFAQGCWPGAPHAWRRQRRGSGAVALLRDVSASMEGRIGAWTGVLVASLVASARRFGLRVGYVEFDHEAHCFRERGRLLHRRYGGLLALAARRRAVGRTSYEAPLRAALDALRNVAQRERHVVLLTDGRPVAGDPEVRAERRRARQLGVRIHTVFVGLGECPAVLDRLSAQTRGLAFRARAAAGGQIALEPRGSGQELE
jgi:MoxR-like ATPase